MHGITDRMTFRLPEFAEAVRRQSRNTRFIDLPGPTDIFESLSATKMYTERCHSCRKSNNVIDRRYLLQKPSSKFFSWYATGDKAVRQVCH
jgi:hypothetical protein